MPTPYLGELKLAAFNFAPKGWALCNGQVLSIAQNQALFSLLGTQYGGDGRTTFALPNLQGAVPLGVGPAYAQGQRGGEQLVQLTLVQMPVHTHTPLAANAAGTQPTPRNGVGARFRRQRDVRADGGHNHVRRGGRNAGLRSRAQQHAALSRAELDYCPPGHLSEPQLRCSWTARFYGKRSRRTSRS